MAPKKTNIKNQNVGGGASNKVSKQSAPAPANNMKIAQDVIANPGNYDPGYSREVASQNPSSVIYQGLYGGGLSDGEGGTYRMQGYYVPGATTGIGPNRDVLFAAGPNANQEWMNANFGPGGRYYGGSSTQGASQAAAADTTSKTKPANVTQALRQAGEGGITKQELNQITKDYDKSAGNVIQRLDVINKNLRSKDTTGINLNSGAANMLIKQAGKQSSYDAYVNALMGKSTYGKGRIGKTLQTRIGTPGSFGEPGIPGTGLMLGGTAIRPGGRETVRGFGKQYEMPKTSTAVGGIETTAGGNQGTGTTGVTTTPTTPEVEQTPMTPEDMKANSTFGIGANLYNWAPGYRRKQSSRGRGSSKTRTLGGATKVAPTANVLGY